jgi:transcriptional regulator with PAS, ATPase and Fis domain
VASIAAIEGLLESGCSGTEGRLHQCSFAGKKGVVEASGGTLFLDEVAD